MAEVCLGAVSAASGETAPKEGGGECLVMGARVAENAHVKHRARHGAPADRGEMVGECGERLGGGGERRGREWVVAEEDGVQAAEREE